MIAVYGATGYTGKLVAAELQRRGIEARLCGRNEAKLRALPGSFETRSASVDDGAALRRAFEDCSAVINCAGPFTFFGQPVIEAALDSGAHYCDTTGEQPYMKRVFEMFDARASAAGLAVVPAVGFDYVPGDLIAALAARGRGPLRTMDVMYAVSGFGGTRGTLHSAIEMMSGDVLDYEDGAWKPAPKRVTGERFDFGGSLGDQPVALYPGGELITVPRHVQTQSMRERITARTFAPHPRLAGTVGWSMPAVNALMRTPLRRGVDKLIDRMPEGPPEDKRRASEFTVVAVAHGLDGSETRATVHGSDVYGITAVIAVEIARTMAADGFSAKGALAPAQAVDPEAFLDFLGDHGVTYDAPAAPALV